MMTQLLASCSSSSGLKLGARLFFGGWFSDEGMVKLSWNWCWWLVDTGYEMGDIWDMATYGSLIQGSLHMQSGLNPRISKE